MRLEARIAAIALAAAAMVAASGVGALEEVPYVPTPQLVVDRMLTMARVGPKDYLIDLGSGDGRLVVTAAKRYGATGLGVDWSEQLVAKAQALASAEGVAQRAKFYKQDIFETDVSKATVITMYLLPDTNLALRPRFLEVLRPGTRIVAHDYDMGDWRPDERVRMEAPGKTVGPIKESEVFFWVVPAKVGGRWKGTLDGKPLELAVEQKFQDLAVRGSLAGAPLEVSAEPVRGERVQLAFSAGGTAYKLDLTARPGRGGALPPVLQGTARGPGSLPVKLDRLPG